MASGTPRVNTLLPNDFRATTYAGRVRLVFCSRDPIGYEGSRWNLYSYCGGYPLRYLDPLGLLIAPPPPVAVNPYLGTFVIGVGIGSIAGKPFWDWWYAPEPWNPVLRPPVPLPVPAPKGDFDPHPHDENFPKDCYDIYISDMDFCAWLFEACMEGCENEEFCDELAKECEDKAVNTLIDCSGESPDWDPKLPDKPPPPPPWEK